MKKPTQNDCASIEDSDQPVDQPSLISVFASCMKKDPLLPIQ